MHGDGAQTHEVIICIGRRRVPRTVSAGGHQPAPVKGKPLNRSVAGHEVDFGTAADVEQAASKRIRTRAVQSACGDPVRTAKSIGPRK